MLASTLVVQVRDGLARFSWSFDSSLLTLRQRFRIAVAYATSAGVNFSKHTRRGPATPWTFP